MTVSDAQKRASAKWDKENMKQRVVRFYPGEEELLNKLDSQPNKAGYLKALIKADIEGRVSW